MKSCQILVFAFILLTSCDKDKPIKTDEENFILELAYNNNYLYPNGFYQETNSQGSVYYENTVSIMPINQRHIWIELSTNDKSEALLWSNNSSNNSSVNSSIISEKENDKYFEFKRQNANYNKDILLSRIHKTSFFQPKLDKFREPDTVGIYNGGLKVDSVKLLIEYLWFNGSVGLGNSKVIKSEINEYDDYYEQYIQSIKIVGGDFNINDYIYVYDNYLKLDKTNRILTIKTNETQTIEGHEN